MTKNQKGFLQFAEGSEIERNLFEGRDRLVDYVNNGCVPELNDVIPHTDPSELPRRLRALSLFKTRGRQVGDSYGNFSCLVMILNIFCNDVVCYVIFSDVYLKFMHLTFFDLLATEFEMFNFIVYF